MKYRIDIESFTNYSTVAENYGTITRRIISKLLLNQNREYKKELVINMDILEYLFDSAAFTPYSNKLYSGIIKVGMIAGMTVYLDLNLKDFEYEYLTEDEINRKNLIEKRNNKLYRIWNTEK